MAESVGPASSVVSARALEDARARIAPLASETPVVLSEPLSELAGAPVWLKLENLQRTGSFKVRGAANHLLSMGEERRQRGVVTCSSGNHGRAVAYVAQRVGARAVICMPAWVDPSKLAAIAETGAETILAGDTYDEAERRSFAVAEERGLTYVHPFDDPLVIAGQGTVGLEIVDAIPDVASVVVPVSGGGLIAGVAAAVKQHDPAIRVVAASARNARVMYESQRVGHPVELAEEHTIATALSGGIGVHNEHTFEAVRSLVDDHVLLAETQLSEAMVLAARAHHLIVEGGGAPGIAAVHAGLVEAPAGPTVVVVSGGNIDLEAWARVVGIVAPEPA